MVGRRGLVAAGAAAVSTYVAYRLWARRRRRRRPPHVVLIVTDQELPWDRLPVTFPLAELPNRCRLKSACASFANFVTAASPCTPSRATLYTGRHFQHTGVFDNGASLGDRAETVGHHLRRAGYATCYAGKFHLDETLFSKFERDATRNDPRLLDGDRSRGLVRALLDEAAARKARKPHPWLGVDFSGALERYGFSEPWASVGDLPGWALEGHAEDPITAAEAAAALGRAGPASEPLFLACNFVNPHDIMFYEAGDGQERTRRRPLFLETMPFARARDLKGFAAGGERDDFGDEDKPAAADEYDDGLPEPYGSRWRALPLSLHADHEELLPNSVLMHQAVVDARFGHLASNAEYERFLDYYLNALRDSDAQLGAVLDAVDDLERRDGRGVVVVFASDHGEMLGAHQCRQKGNVLYRENVSTPFLVRAPGMALAPGAAVGDVVSAVDVLPTILDYAGVQIPADLPGASLKPRLDGAAPRHGRSAALVQFGLDYGKFFRRVAASRHASSPQAGAPQPHLGGWVVDTAALASEALAQPMLVDTRRSSSGESLGGSDGEGSTPGGSLLDGEIRMRAGMEVISDARRANMVPQRCVRRSVTVMARTLELRALGQCVVTGRHKFGRFFSPRDHQLPETWDALFEANDVVAYDTLDDPYELVNLAHPRYRDRNRALLLRLNDALNAAIAAETATPGPPRVPWTSRRRAGA